MTLPTAKFSEPHRDRESSGEQSLRNAERLVAELGLALHRYGTPAHRLEAAMHLLSGRLGLAGEFFSTPTAIFASLRPSNESAAGGTPRTLLLRVEPGEVNLEKLERLDRVLGEVLRAQITLDEALGKVESIVRSPLRWGPVVTILAFALASASTSRFFGADLLELAASGVLGIAIGAFSLVAGRFPNAGRLYEAFSAFFAAWCGSGIVTWLAHRNGIESSLSIIAIATLIVLFPGLTLTVSVTELAARNLVSGAARVAGAGLMFLMIGMGYALGRRVGEMTWGAPPSEGLRSLPALPGWTEPVAVLVAALALLVLFRAAPRELPAFVFAGGIALYGSRAGSSWMGPELGVLIGALLLGLVSNLIARIGNRPATLTVMPGLMLLVPGSLGFRSVDLLVQQDTIGGIQGAFTVVLIAISLATGLLLASVIIPPRQVL